MWSLEDGSKLILYPPIEINDNSVIFSTSLNYHTRHSQALSVASGKAYSGHYLKKILIKEHV